MGHWEMLEHSSEVWEMVSIISPVSIISLTEYALVQYSAMTINSS